MKQKIVVAVTGASGSIYAKQLLTQLALFPNLEIGVVLSLNAPDVWKQELQEEVSIPSGLTVYDRKDYFAPFASGSARYTHMVICPCSMGTLGRIAHGISDDLITRAADVILKERRKLVCVVRDTPFNLIHIENMKTVTLAGGMIMPAAPSFYSQPASISQLADTVVHRIIDQLGLDSKGYQWG
jgi:4-hydroxy-3-polyprenylbenzoate decarboxylase